MTSVALVVGIGLGGSARGQGPTTPESVWAGFDPRDEPREVEVLRRWTEHGASYREFTFTGMTHEGSRVRVYAIASVPEGRTRLPGVLHVHGGGQTVNPAWLRFWNDRGYAALTFNWGGVWPGREKFTDWGKLTQGNHRDAGRSADGDEALGPGIVVVSVDSGLATGADLPGGHEGGRSRAAGRLRRLDGRHDRLADRGDGPACQGGLCHLRRGLDHPSRRDRRTRPEGHGCGGDHLAAGDGAGVVRRAGEVPDPVPGRHQRPARQHGLGVPYPAHSSRPRSAGHSRPGTAITSPPSRGPTCRCGWTPT